MRVLRVEEVLLQLEQRAGQCGGEVGNHGCLVIIAG